MHTAPLRRLYLVRFAFAVVWAVLFVALSSPYGTAALVLAVLYPAFDLAAAVVDARTTDRSMPALYVNMVLSAAAAVALLVVGTGDVGRVLVVWGLWAVTAGAVQLAVGVGRRSL